MKKFWKINYILYRNAIRRDLKISLTVLTGSLVHLLDGVVSLAIVLIVYSKTDFLGGWNIYESLILIAFVQIIVTLHSSWTKRGTADFTEKYVRMGDYDFYLTKPFDPMLSVSISKPRVYNLIRLPFFVAIFAYSVCHLEYNLSIINWGWFILLFVASFILFYAIRILTISPAFWIVKSHSLLVITDRMQNIMKYPANIYPRFFILFFTTLLPIFAISYLPVKVLLFDPKLSYIIYVIVLTALFLFLARILWRAGEKRYGSASS